MLVKGIFQLELLKNRFERNLDSLVKPGNDDFLCVFHEQATQTQDCDTASQSGNDRIHDLFLPRSRALRTSLIDVQNNL